MQYSKFNNPDSVVRDVTSTAQAICVETLEDGYYEHTNVSLYLGAAIALPVATSVVSTLVVWKHYEVIILYVENKRKKPNAVGMAMAGIYITLYMLCMDISAVYYFISGRHEYGTYDTIRNTFNLHLTWCTLAVEFLASLFILFFFWVFISMRYEKSIDKKKIMVTIIKHIAYIFAVFYIFLFAAFGVTFFAYNSIVENLSLQFIITSVTIFIAFALILLIFDISKRHNDFVVYFIVIPITYLSAHVDYIFTAWLTEPSKTTSVAILAIAVVFYLFIMSRSIYNFMKFEDDRISLLLTFFLGFGGVGLGAVQIAAFYIIPIPAIHLADYLDNVFQISLVILAALISYKILSTEDSDASKFFKQFNKAKKDTMPSKKLWPYKSLKLDAKITAEYCRREWSTKKEHNQLYLFTELKKYNLLVSLPGRDDKKYVTVPVSDVTLTCGPLPLECEEVHYPLTDTMLSFKVLNYNKSVSVSLREATLGKSLTNCELRFIRQNNTGSYLGTLFRSMIQCDTKDIIAEPTVISITIPCCITKNDLINSTQGMYCRFDNSFNITVVIPSQRKYIRNDCYKVQSLTIIPGDSASVKIVVRNPPIIGYSISIGADKILTYHFCRMDVPMELERYCISVYYSFLMNQSDMDLQTTRINGHSHLLVRNANREILSIPASHIQNECASVLLRANSNLGSTITTNQYQAKSFNEKFTLHYSPTYQFRFCSDVPDQNNNIDIGDNVTTLQLQNFKLVFTQIRSSKTKLRVTNNQGGQEPNILEVVFSIDDGECKLNVPVPTNSDIHSLELKGQDLANKVPSFLYFPRENPQEAPDEFEDAGLACGEAVHKFRLA